MELAGVGMIALPQPPVAAVVKWHADKTCARVEATKKQNRPLQG